MKPGSDEFTNLCMAVCFVLLGIMMVVFSVLMAVMTWKKL